MNGADCPAAAPAAWPRRSRPLYETQALHRYVAGVVALIIVWTCRAAAWRDAA